ncbi:MAG: DNA-directed RNA polymerase subunit beta', partial [Minisyncoccales bacterium]
PEITTSDIPNVSEKKLKNLNSDGLIRIGAEVFPGDILVGKISPKGEKELTPEEKLLKAIFGEKTKEVKDTSLKLEHGRKGKVIRIRVFERDKGAKLEAGVIKRIEVEVAELRKIQMGDKLAGRYGNKGTISKILPIEEMPFLEDGTPVDLIISPLSVISRMNLGQLMETNLGLAAKKLSYHAITPALSGASEEEIKEELKKAGFSEIGKLKLFDGRTGEPFQQRITVGYLYTMKLIHMVADKFHARAIGPYSLITQQPVGGRAQYGGQRFGEMEAWALEGYGAANTLQEMLTIKSDDVLGRAQTYQDIIKGEEIKTPTIPASFSLLVSELKSLGLKVNINKIQPSEVLLKEQKEKKKKEFYIEDIDSISIRLASPEEILDESHGEVLKTETINYRTQRPERDGLFCERIFGPTKNYQCYCGKFKGIRYKGVICDRCQVEVTHSSVRRERMGHVRLATPVVHIWFLKGIPSRLGLVLDIPLQQLEKVIYFTSFIVKRIDEEKKEKLLRSVKEEYKEKIKNKTEKEKEELRKIRDSVVREINSLVPRVIFSESEYRYFAEKYGDIFEAGTGAEALEEICREIDLKKEIKKVKEELKTEGDLERQKKKLLRLKVLQDLYRTNIRPEWMFLRVLPVLPPDLRPIVQLESGRFASSDLNDLYRRIINRNNRLKYLLEIGAPEIIVRNEKRMLQEAVDVLIDNGMRKTMMVKTSTGGRREIKSLASILEGKDGRFRQNLLGKRVDYSARSVIVAGPELKMNQVGLPKKMALEIFKPFVINKLLEREIVFNIREALRLIEEETDEVWAILEEVIKDKLVLLNRAPTLHRLNIQAFYPILIEGLAIKLHPVVCKAYNADFDGDQMAVFLPLSSLAQKEAKEIMLSSRNILKPATGMPFITVYQDIVLGLYWLTSISEKKENLLKVFSSFDEAIIAFENRKIDLREKIKILHKNEWLETSVGRIIFNRLLPPHFPFFNQIIKNKDIEQICGHILEKYPLSCVEEVITKIKDCGIEFSTLAGISLAISDLVVPKEKKSIILNTENEIKKIEDEFKKGFLSLEEKKRLSIEAWLKAKNEIEKIIPQSFPKEGPVFQIIDAKARGGWLQPMQMSGMKGMVISPSGEIIELPILHSYRDGFSCLEYFISCHGARKGVTDKALSTAVAGYLTRRLIDVAHHVIIREKDCKDKKGVEIRKEEAEEIFQDFENKIVGRISLDDIPGIVKGGEMIDWEKARKIAKNKKIRSVRVRSPFSCKIKNGVCQQCYGWDLGRNKLVEMGEAVGVVAAQSIGEPGVQLTLRAFHVGGVAGAGYMISGLPRLNEIFEARTPVNKATICLVEGKVKKIESDKIIVEEKKTKKLIEYRFLPGKKIFVKETEKVKPGMVLTEGSLDPKELYYTLGKTAVLKYLLKEAQKNYISQGAFIHDKHLELILKLMFSKVRVIDPGDSFYSPGEIVDGQEFENEVKRLKKENKKIPKAKEILLGISRVAFNSTSFLSAASFQETSRVLISAALQGRVDRLEGLKENIIIGRKIPAGTGFKERFLKEVI